MRRGLPKLSEPSYAVQCDHIFKRYKTTRVFEQGLKGYLFNFIRLLFAKTCHYTAVSELDLAIAKGECFGIIGKNGAGKSTILGMIAEVIYPSSGKLTVNGRIAPLLELGAGFHSDLTGRENIVINGILLGLTKREITAKINDIIDFSGLADFIDQPMRTYSTGMYMRLGFSVAVNIEPEILLVDEVLAVGDEEFQQKCITRMKEFKQQGVTIIFVSHAMTVAEQVCDRIALIEKGRVIKVGQPSEVIKFYRDGKTE